MSVNMHSLLKSFYACDARVALPYRTMRPSYTRLSSAVYRATAYGRSSGSKPIQ